MANKKYTPSLIPKKRKRLSFWRTIFKKKSDNGFYFAKSLDGRVTLLWIEANQFGKTNCYPGVLTIEGQEWAWADGMSNKAKRYNQEMIARWTEVVDPRRIDAEYDVTELTPEQFCRDFGPAQDRVMRELFLPKDAGSEEGPAEEAGDAAEQIAAADVQTAEDAAEDPKDGAQA